MSRILLIEDNPRHMTDAKSILETRVKSGVISAVEYISTLDNAMRTLESGIYDGILSDVFFPKKSGSKEEPNGVEVGKYALDKGTPVVLVTSTYHHGDRTQPVSEWARQRHMQLIDRLPPADSGADWEAPSKDWEVAYLVLTYLIEGRSGGEITINTEGLSPNAPLKYLNLQNLFTLRLDMKNYGGKQKQFDRRSGNDPVFKRTVEKYCQGMMFE